MEQELGDPRRVLSLDYAQNVRDLGGYSTADGRTTAWGRCVRSGDMDQLSTGDRQALVAHGVDTVIDLRMEKEIAAAPNRFQDSGDVHFVIHDFWGQRFDNYRSRNKGAPPEVKLADLYCQGLVQSAFVMAAIMRTVAAADGGVAFHCRSGKDRTGLVAAFLLDLAGVPRTVICEDYGLTAALLTSPDADKQLDPKQPGAYLRGCAPETMDRTLAFVDETFGGVHAYLKQEGVKDVELNAIRAKLVEA
ncbi:MAG: hypothetical protein CMQ24_21105 [Gammaproteobacteria bacterium]|nr:hypothetical protein [Gammaproteobacteria bacterium]